MWRHQKGVKCHTAALPPTSSYNTLLLLQLGGTSANTDASTVLAHIAKYMPMQVSTPLQNLMQIPGPLSVIVSMHN